MTRRLPEHLRTKEGRERLKALRTQANGLRGILGEPVYLCGSALMDFNKEPRDWDIRVTLTDAHFKRKFGDPKEWQQQGSTGKWTQVRWRWSDFCVKQSQRFSRWTGLNCDVQVYPMFHVKAMRYEKAPRLRLDTRQKAAV